MAAMLRDEPKKRKKELRNAGAETWAKLKFDRQIVAIAKVVGATTVYSDDDGVETVATRSKIQVTRTCDLPLPPETLQGELTVYGNRDV